MGKDLLLSEDDSIQNIIRNCVEKKLFKQQSDIDELRLCRRFLSLAFLQVLNLFFVRNTSYIFLGNRKKYYIIKMCWRSIIPCKKTESRSSWIAIKIQIQPRTITNQQIIRY